MKRIIETLAITYILGFLCALIDDNELMLILLCILKLVAFYVFVGVSAEYVNKYNTTHDTKLSIAPLYIGYIPLIVSLFNVGSEQIPIGVFHCTTLLFFVAFIYVTERTVKTLKRPWWYILLAFIPIARLFILNSIFKTIDNENKNV